MVKSCGCRKKGLFDSNQAGASPLVYVIIGVASGIAANILYDAAKRSTPQQQYKKLNYEKKVENKIDVY